LFKPVFGFAFLCVDTYILRSSTLLTSFSTRLFLSNSTFRAIEPFFLKIYHLSQNSCKPYSPASSSTSPSQR
ncbi:MAG: hypothetical protein PV337_04985, partial [Rickettsiaceae bacterium]|nr:hypothetical protein [Rickettsiaceae bacterium]